MSSIPVRLVVNPQQFATAEDTLAFDTLNHHYLLQMATKLQGDHSEGAVGGVGNPLGYGSVINGCNASIDVANGVINIAQGMVLFQNEVPDPTAGEGFNTKGLAICPAQSVPIPSLSATLSKFWVVYLIPEFVNQFGVRTFLDSGTGGVFTQNVQVAKGLQALATSQVFGGQSNSDDMVIGLLPTSSANAIPVALVYLPKSSVSVDSKNVFDVRPLQSRGPSRGAITMSAANHPTDDTRCRISLINLDPLYSEPVSSTDNDWLQTATTVVDNPGNQLNKETSTPVGTVVVSPEVFAADYPAGDLPPMNVVFEDGSWRRSTLRKEGGQLSGVGSTLSALPNGLNWIYVYAVRSRSNSIPLYVLSSDPPNNTIPAWGTTERGGFKFFTTPPKPFDSLTLSTSDVKGWCVGMLPLIKTSSATFRWQKFRAFNERLYFPTADVNVGGSGPALIKEAQQADLVGTSFTVLTEAEAAQILPQWGSCRLQVNVHCVIQSQGTSASFDLFECNLLAGTSRIATHNGIATPALETLDAPWSFEVELSGKDIGSNGLSLELTPRFGSSFHALLFRKIAISVYLKEVHWPRMGAPTLSLLDSVGQGVFPS